MRVFMTGATGLIGSRIVPRLLDRNDRVVVLTRDVDRAKEILGQEAEFVEGAPQVEGDWMKEIDGTDGVINLAGEHIFARRWSTVQKTEIRNSRIFSTWNVASAIEQAETRPEVLVSTSGVSYYGDVPAGDLDEQSPAGDDFLARLATDWENAALKAEASGVRVVLVRVGVVLAKKGGALDAMKLPFQLGLGGPVGNGKQWVSWIHVDDLADVYVKALHDKAISGPINGTAPVPVTNKQFSKEFAAALHRPCLLPVPETMVRIALGEVSQVVTTGQRALPRKLRRLNFPYRYPTCQEAMQSLFNAG